MKRFLADLVTGVLIGAGAILPGISGASLAVVFGVYEEITAALSHPRRHLATFCRRRFALCIGTAIGFALFALLLGKLFDTQGPALIFLFSGFIAGTLPGIFQQARKRGTGPLEVASFCLTFGLFVFACLHGSRPNPVDTGTEAAIYPLAWILSGASIGAGSLLPGVSASFILIYFKMYGPLLEAVAHRELVPLALLGSGALLALIALSRLIHWLYGRFHGIVSFAVLGATLGSLMLVFPRTAGPQSLAYCLPLAAAGFVLSFFLDRLKGIEG